MSVGPRPQAFYVGEGASRCFAMLHLPQGAPRAGVVLVSPLHWDGIATHRTHRKLAERLAAEGLAVLRFDLPASGDSAGADSDPGLVPLWVDAVGAAIDALKQRAGVTSVGLFALRLAGTIALVGASRRDDVAAIAVLSPYTKGRAFVREARAYRMLNSAGADVAPKGLQTGDEEVAGFLVSAATGEALGELDLLKLTRKPAARVLLLQRDDQAADDKLAAALTALGAEVTTRPQAGVPALLQEPRKSEVPLALLDACSAFFSSLTGSLSPAQPLTDADRALVTGQFHEQPFALECTRGGVFGVLTLPAHGQPREVLVQLPVAAHHRVGPNRMHVPLARSAASLGLASLRVDLCGLGDGLAAPGTPENGIYDKEFLGDARELVDALLARGFTKVALAGLCSGSYLAYHASVADERVSGQVLINPQTFEWRAGDPLEIASRMTYQSTHHYKTALFQWKTWSRVLTGKVDYWGLSKTFASRFGKLIASRAVAIAGALSGRGSDSAIARRFKAVARRGAESLLVFSGGDEGLDLVFLHLGGGAAAMKGFDNFKLEIVEGPDHTFTQIWAQRWLIDTIVGRVTSRWGLPARS